MNVMNMMVPHEEQLLDFAGVGRWVNQCAEAHMRDLVSDAAITGAALVRHLDDARFACLRALRQLLRALDADGPATPLAATSTDDPLDWIEVETAIDSVVYDALTLVALANTN